MYLVTFHSNLLTRPSIRHYSSLRRVLRRTLASGTYPNALLPLHTSLVLRAPPPVTVAFARPAPDMLLSHSLPVAGAGSQSNIGCETARAQPCWVLRALSKPPCGVVGGPGPAGCWAASLHLVRNDLGLTPLRQWLSHHLRRGACFIISSTVPFASAITTT